MDDVHAALQALITQAKKDGMIRASDLNAQLEKMQLTPEKKLPAAKCANVSAHTQKEFPEERHAGSRQFTQPQ